MTSKTAPGAAARPAGAAASRKRPQPAVDAARSVEFLEHLARTGSVTIACERAGLARSAVYARRERSRPFREAWKRAVDLGVESLHDRAMERALEGEERPVIKDGEQVATVRRFDNRLVLALLRAHRGGFGATPAAPAPERAAELLQRFREAEKRLANHRAYQARRQRKADERAAMAAETTTRPGATDDE